MSDLRQRVPGHSLIDELLNQWELGNIHPGTLPGEIVIDDEALGWYRGVIGERHVAAILEQLGDGWTVLHSVPAGTGGRDIDHLVVGPAGVFTINTKFSPNSDVWSAGFGLYVGGHPQKKYVRASVTELEQAERELSRRSGLTVPVVGLIVFVQPGKLDRKAPAADNATDVRVISDRELLGTLQTRPIFSTDQVERIAAAASDAYTWLASPKPSTIGAHISQEFAALEEAVGPALAAPRARVSQPATRQSPASTRPASRAASSSKPRRTSSRRKKRSPLEQLISGVAPPLLAAGVAWFYFTYVFAK